MLEQSAALPLSHPAPNTELNAVVQRIGAALRDHRAMPADHGRFALCGAADEELVGVGGATARLRYPRDASFCCSTSNRSRY